jgi:hypothetical protein
MLLERSAVIDAQTYERTFAQKSYSNGFNSKSLHTPLATGYFDLV